MAEIRKEPIESYYDVGEELGRGRFAVVRKCTSKKSGEVFAGKFVRKARQGRSAREQLLLEIDILHTSRHPKMVRLYDVFETRTEMVLVIEYAPGGDLHRHCLEQVETVRTEKEICYLIRQIVEAVRYLHENNVVHLDLKPENILLKSDSRFPEIRLIDFGLSRRLDVPYSQFDIVGTPEYVAPEVLAYEPLDVNADMWSIGVVTYVLLSGISPFAGDDVMETYANIGQVEYDFDAEEFDDISDEAKDFIENLLIRQQKKRMSSREALEHSWLKQLEDGIKPEDIADAIKAESIIPTDVLAKAAELNPVQEDTVSDAESEDYLSRDSVSSPEEENSSQDVHNANHGNLKEGDGYEEVPEVSKLTGKVDNNEDRASSHDDDLERSDSESEPVGQGKEINAQGKTEDAKSHGMEDDEPQATGRQNSVEAKSKIPVPSKQPEKKVDSAVLDNEPEKIAHVTLPDKVSEKKTESIMLDKEVEQRTDSAFRDKAPEKEIESPVPDKVPKTKICPTDPDREPEKKVEPVVPDKVPEKKIEPAVPDKVMEKKIEPAVPDKVPGKKVESAVSVKIPEKKPESTVSDKVPEKKESTGMDKVPKKKTESILPNKVSENKIGFARSHSEPENKTGASKTVQPFKDESKSCALNKPEKEPKKHHVSLDTAVVTHTSPAPQVSDEKPTVVLQVQSKTESSKDSIQPESTAETLLPVPSSQDKLEEDKVLPESVSASSTSKETRTPSFALYDTLLSGLETGEIKNFTSEKVNEDSRMPDATVERKKSSAIDIDAILGVSDSAQKAQSAQVNKEVEPSPVKKTFNIDSIIGVHTTHTEGLNHATEAVDQQGRGNQSSKGKALQKQCSLESQPPHKEKSSKIKAAASIFDKEKEERLDMHSKPDSKPERSNGPWKSPTNRSMRYSLEMHDPKPKMILEKSKSADAEEEGKKLESRHGPVSGNISKVGSGDVGHSSRPSSLGTTSKLQVQGSTNKTPSPCDDVKAVRHGIAAQMASKFSGLETNVPKEQGKGPTPLKEKEAVLGKVSQRIHELSSSSTRKEISSPPSSRSSSERSTPERTLLDRKTPERSKSERNSAERALADRKTPERSSSDKGSSGRSTPERKVLDRGLHSRSSSERSTPERGSPERSASPVDSARRGNVRSREISQPVKVSDRVKRAEVMFKKEASPPNASSPKQGLTLGKGAPMKLVVGESFKVDFSPSGGVQLGSKITPKESTVPEENALKGERTSSIRSKFEENNQGSPVKPKKGAVPSPLENVNGAGEDTETKPRSKTDTEALRKAAEIIRNAGEHETGRKRQPSMAELRGKNPSQRGEKGSPSSPRKSYRRLYVTHVKGSKALEVVEGALSDVAEVKQKVDEDGLQVQLVMKLPTF